MLYPKTENLLKRGEDGVCLPQLRWPEFEAVRGWRITEKVDGMNIRIELRPETGEARIFGRTDNAQLPARLIERINEHLLCWMDCLPQADGRVLWLFGEGYGAKIQQGGDYVPYPSEVGGQDFVLFDAARTYEEGGRFVWLEAAEVEELGYTLGLPLVPVIGSYMSLEEAVFEAQGYSCLAQRNCARAGLPSEKQREGVIATSVPILLDRFGSRIKAKIKAKDIEAAGGPDYIVNHLPRF